MEMSRVWLYPAILALFLSNFLLASAADDLLSDQHLHDIYLEMRAEDWQSLRDKFLEDTKYPAAFAWNGVQFARVSVRSRGGSSRNPIKPSLKIDFDNYVKDQTFDGLKSLVLDNNYQDLSQIKERLTMKLMRELGLPAPRESSARIMINGQFAGIYTVVEPVDKVFLKARFGENSGTLYEFNQTGTWRFEDLGSDPAAYSPEMFEPKTNEENPNTDRLISFVQFVNHSTSQDFPEKLAQQVDTQKLLLYIAIQQYVAEVDGLNGWNGSNNFYLYQSAADPAVFTFIPWDEDLTFRDPAWSALFNFQETVITRRIWDDPGLRQMYFETLRSVAEFSGGAEGWLASEADWAHRQVRSAVLADPSNGCAEEESADGCAPGRSLFEEESEMVRRFVQARYELLIRELDWWQSDSAVRRTRETRAQ